MPAQEQEMSAMNQNSPMTKEGDENVNSRFLTCRDRIYEMSQAVVEKMRNWNLTITVIFG